MANTPYYITAYGLAVKHGFEGTEQEWLESLVGKDGKDGTVAFEALTDEQRAMLKGEPGAQGKQGEPGSDAQVTEENIRAALGYGPVSPEELKKEITARNLLDNAYFLQPVNRRGQGSYTAAGYTIDRWLSKNEYAVTVGSGGLTVAESVHQYVRDAVPGSVYTLAAMDDAGTLYINSGKPEDNTWHDVCGMYAEDGAVWVRLSGKTFQWAVMYEGPYTEETLPVYRAREFSVEKATCEEFGDSGVRLASEIRHLTPTLSLSLEWEGDTAPYTQSVAVDGILETDNPHYGLLLSGTTEQMLAQKESFGYIDELKTADGLVTFTCLEDKPDVVLTIQLEVNR